GRQRGSEVPESPDERRLAARRRDRRLAHKARHAVRLGIERDVRHGHDLHLALDAHALEVSKPHADAEVTGDRGVTPPVSGGPDTLRARVGCQVTSWGLHAGSPLTRGIASARGSASWSTS